MPQAAARSEKSAVESCRINPFGTDDPDRRAVWDMLVTRDSIAFVNRDWAAVENDFDAQTFEGVHADASNNPDDWTVKYPTLEAYRDDWLRMGDEFQAKRPVTGTLEDLLFRITRLEKIEISGDRMLCHKKFKVDEVLADGSPLKVSLQTLYRLHRKGGQWKIVGFVGYLPL